MRWLIFAAKFGIISTPKTQEEKKMVFGFLQNIGPWQLVICVIVAFVLFGGAKKIPELAKALGKAKNEFKKGLAEEKEPEPAKELV